MPSTSPSAGTTAPIPTSTDEEFDILNGVGDSDLYEPPDLLQSYIQNPSDSIPLSRYDHNFALDTDGSQSPSSDDQTSEDKSFGKWPRRLLHVPSMTSQKWKPGCKYGDYVEPKYNAISYTWGRYDLAIPSLGKIKKYRHTKAIEIKGIDWPIPRISPEHFSLDQFQHLIWQACEPVDGEKGRTDFLWLDVACIDQNNGPQKLAEIGRQAAIFHGAQRVFVWLTKVCKKRLSQIMMDLMQTSHTGKVYADKKDDHSNHAMLLSWLATARASLDGLFIDPWFSSLWTLQEAFLCQHAYVLPLEADLIPIGFEAGFKTGSHATLEVLCKVSTSIKQTIEREAPIVRAQWQSNKANPEICKLQYYLLEVDGMLSQRGLLALATRNPIALYSIAQYRKTMRDQDRVYGIQQIFGVRLGASAPGVPESRSKHFNRFVLEDQLGAAILGKYPVASQVHIFMEPVEEGRGWRVSGSSTVPTLEIQSSIWRLEFEHRCHLSTRNIKRQRWAFFRGRTCGFAELSRAWKAVQKIPSISKVLGAKSPQQIMLDTFLERFKDEHLIHDPEEPIWTAVWSKRKEIPRNEQQHRLAWGLNAVVPKEFNGESPIVLLLGSFTDRGQREQVEKEPTKYHVGLILVLKKTGTSCHWKRLGFCIWQYGFGDLALENIVSPHLALVRAEEHCEGWKPLSGHFG